ncbi:aminotransferase class I/II-fold pyridoxal phosphate-dependent enzyme [Spongiactinospora sp. TRM90649]|uniref:aminotransferase class I/II-fold pyridoxal phosphate-dependent enzyme n=1 Tax=Spongiactinospora sp. TRM90649 TaxID=3031114 RepID=UPI0023F67AED|nr:aminotransferase class I/II-fold pyridoxal phosphate-dependent enzyme [Spongiactinospora sp. TRM90649]MDF5759041.1 aminotransferase class I/II-fold pyridoxal phosphate-dependent enzyme [Spongiactinospora sp. TRM90649]
MALYQYSLLTADAQVSLARQVIATGRLGSIGGMRVPQFEAAVAARIGRAHATAMASATAALEVTLRALNVGPGCEVVIPALGWISLGAAVTATGASVRVASTREHLTPSFEDVAHLLTADTRAVVIAHLRGWTAPDIARIAAELRRRGIPLIEDCAQAWGAPGAGSYGTAAFFSTQTYKVVATGEGGLALCDDPELASRIRALAGDTRVRTPTPLWRGNARMPEISAALALPQLDQLDDLVQELRSLQRPAAELLSTIGTVLPGDLDAGNGTHVGVWLDTPAAAEAFSSRLADLHCWRPTVGDLHTCAAWPVDTQAGGWDRYLDIQIPYTDRHARRAFLDCLRRAIKGVQA